MIDETSAAFFDSLKRAAEYLSQTDAGRAHGEELLGLTQKFMGQIENLTNLLSTCIAIQGSLIRLMHSLIKEMQNKASSKESLARLKIRSDAIVDQLKMSVEVLPVKERSLMNIQIDKYNKMIDEFTDTGD